MRRSDRAIVTRRVSSSEADTIAQIVLNGRPMIFQQLRYLALCALLVLLGSAWAAPARATTTFEFATAEEVEQSLPRATNMYSGSVHSNVPSRPSRKQPSVRRTFLDC